jgi:lysophospholipase L1-like esterase
MEKTMKKLFRTAASSGALFALLSAPLYSQTTFRKYVALGDSLTAAVEGNCLVERHQRKSFPKLVADQLGISDFQQPFLSELPLTSPGTGVCLGTIVAGGAITVGPVSNQGFPQNSALARAYDNLGLPGAVAADLVDLRLANPGGGTAARAATLVLRNAPTQPFEGRNAIEIANQLSPDLLTLWIGNNDVLGAALSGAAIEGVTLTPVALFDAKYTQLMAGLRTTGRRVVVLNIPDVAAIPFTMTIPPVVVNPATRQPVLVNGQPVPLLGPRTTATCTTAPCPLPAGTLVTLGASPLLGLGLGIPASLGGSGAPLPDGGISGTTFSQGVILYPDEVALIRERGNALNARIATIAAANGATVLDTHGLYDDMVAHGYEVGGGITLTTAFLTGGIFSADGFHASNLGYAIVATEIVKHVNQVAGTDFELPDMAQALFAPDVPFGTASVPDPSAGPFQYSMRTWKDLVGSAGALSGDLEVVFPTPGKNPSRSLVP